MKKKLICTLLVAFTFAFGLSAQETNSDYKNALEAKNGVGVAFFTPENFSGSDMLGGLCYQHIFNKKAGLECGGSVFWNPDGYSDPLYYNIYAEGDYVLFQSEVSKLFASRLFGWALLAHTGNIYSKYDSDTGSYKNNEFSPNFKIGIGFGFDMIFFRHISFPLKFGFTGSFAGAGFTFGGGIKYVW